MPDINYYPINQSFKRSERLRSKKHVGELFTTNEFFFQYPFKVLHQQRPGKENQMQVLITVPRRNHKNAVDRNRIKRLVREAWRKNKSALVGQLRNQNQSVDVGLIYTAKTIPAYKEIEGKIILILQRLNQVYAGS
jgi:ribonuclease P protein component